MVPLSTPWYGTTINTTWHGRNVSTTAMALYHCQDYDMASCTVNTMVCVTTINTVALLTLWHITILTLQHVNTITWYHCQHYGMVVVLMSWHGTTSNTIYMA